MTPKKLLETCETLNWLSQRLNEMSPDKEALAQAALCLAASTVCLELAHHKQNGESNSSALRSTVRGDMELTVSPLQSIAAKYFH